MSPMHNSDFDSDSSRHVFFCRGFDETSSDEPEPESPPERRRVSKPSRKSRTGQCLNRSAVMARENRIRKKMYVESIEKELKGLREECGSLRGELSRVKKRNEKMETEVKYLRGVIASRTSITRLIKGLNEAIVKKPALGDLNMSLLDSDPLVGSDPLLDSTDPQVGICLHIASGLVSLGYCPHCNFSSTLDSDSLL